MKTFISLTLAACCLMGAAADDLVVDNYERENVVVTNGDVSVGSVFSAKNAAAVEKTGSDVLTLSAAAVQTPSPVPVRVLEGEVNLVPGTDPGLAEPECMQRAALWFDASRGSTIVASENATGGEVARWYDVRETCTEGLWSTNHYCAEAKISFVTNEVSEGVWEKVIRYPVKKTALTNDMDYIDFNGKSSGSWMRLLSKKRSDLGAIANIHHVYYSGCVSNTWGFPLGANSGYSVFWHPAHVSALDLLGANSTDPGVFSGTMVWNGEVVSPYAKSAERGPYLHEWHAGNTLGTFGNFFNDRNIWSASTSYRCGGDALGEVVVFTNRLSAAERMAVGAYLLRKWVKKGHDAGAFAVSAATNAVVSMGAGVSAVISGAGDVQAADGADVSYSVKLPPAGTVRVPSGSASIHSGEIPLAFAAGDAVSVGHDYYWVLSATNAPDASLAAAESATLAFTSTSCVRVASLPDGLKRLSASGSGELVLSPPCEDFAPKAGGDIFATMPNADAEERQSSVTYSATGTYYHWTVSSRTSGSQLHFVSIPAAKVSGNWVIDSAHKEWFRYDDYPFQGNMVMVLKQGIVVENTVTFPQSGDYELTFLSAGRLTNVMGSEQYAGGQVKMSLVRDGVTKEIGTAMGYVGYATCHQRFRIRDVEAGSYKFVLNQDVGSGDAHTILDDFRFRLITEPETETVVRPPNYDFERAEIPFASRNKYSAANTVADWTFATSELGATGTPDVCVLTRGIADGATYLDSGSQWGGVQLALYGSSAAITSSTFTLPAGTWRLRCRMGGMFFSENTRKWNGSKTNRPRNLQGWLIVDGEETSLGTTGVVYDPAMETYTFSSPVTLDAEKTVQLRVQQIYGNASNVSCAIIDDMEFVLAGGAGELVLADAFESTAGWTLTAIRDGSAATSKSMIGVTNPCRPVPTANPTWPYAYGITYGVNERALELCQHCTAVKDVTFPEAGTYELDYSSRSRVWIYAIPSMTYSGNKLEFFLVDSNGATNAFHRSPCISTTNFVFRSVLFNVPAAGTYKFGIMSLSGMPLADGTHLRTGPNANDQTAFVDQVLIRKADETALPDIPETVSLDLSDNARLRLDFAGTNRVDGLRLNGTSVAGWIDATHPSGLISGVGCLYVRPKGTIVLIR